jgi:hypothetical protein
MKDIVERRQDTGASSESVGGISLMSKASGVGDECGCGVWEDEEVKQLTVSVRLLMCTNRACKLTANDGAEDNRIGCVEKTSNWTLNA